MSLARRVVTAISWNLVANSIKLAVLFVRSILLARWLPVEVFGIYGFAAAIVNLSTVVVNFGMGPAFLHRAPETEDEEQAAAVHFTLKLVFTLVWVALLVAFALTFSSGPTRTALLLLTVTTGGIQLAETPKLILARRVVHRRLALIGLASVSLSTLVTLSLAWHGATLWALLATDLVSSAFPIVALYIWRPVWLPRLAWSPAIVRYFLRFGSRSLLVSALAVALDNVDDLWTGRYLGETSLGFYSRAYKFATYPRSILAAPVNTVAGGTFAELKGDRLRLSQSFYRINAFLACGGFFLAGLLALVAPEFIRLVLGAKWLPMLSAFRLMLVFTLLDPLRKTTAYLFLAVGKPEQIARTYFIQLGTLVAGLFLLGSRLDIAGVALAVDIMLVMGMAILLWRAKTYVDISLRRLFVVPGLALVFGMLLARSAAVLLGVLDSDWSTGFTEFVVFSGIYGIVILALEYRQLSEVFSFLTTRLANKTRQ